MKVYLASPNNQVQAHAASEMPVLLSFAIYSNWLDQYAPTFERILIDSGAYSEFNTGKKIDIDAYADWAPRWINHADAIAGLDDISGNWRQSMKNYERFPIGFPTFHESDPSELLDDLIAIAKERKQWLGIGLIPPRGGKEDWMRSTLERIPEEIHVHGWACRAYTHIRRINSVDSTNWWRDAFQLKINNETKHLTYAECLEIVIKRYKRWNRVVIEKKEEEPMLFSEKELQLEMVNE